MTTFTCPGCGTPLTSGTPKCASCGIRLVGEVAGQLWLLDQQLVALRARRETLLATLRLDEPPPSAPADPWQPTASVAGVASATTRRAVDGPAPAGVETRTVLLWLGASCLVAALVAGTALLWSSLGATGQALVMLGLTAGLLTAAVRLRRLPATAEALAAVGVAAVGIDLIAGRSLGVPLLHHVSDRTYWTIGSLLALLTLSAVTCARRELASPAVGATAAGFAALIAVVWPTTVAGVAAAGTIAVIAAVALLRWSVHLPTHRPAVRATAAAAGVMGALVGLLAAVVAASERDGATVCGLVIAGILALLPEALRSTASTARRRGCAAGAGVIVAVLGLLADVASWRSHLPSTAVACVALVAVLVAVPRRRDWADRAVFGVATVAGLAGAIAQLRLQELAVDGIAVRSAGWSLLAVVALLVVVTVRSAEEIRPAWAVGAATVGLAAVAEIASSGASREVAATAVAAVAAAVTLAALTPRRLDARGSTVLLGDAVASVGAAATVIAGFALSDDLAQLATVTAGLAAGAVAPAPAVPPPPLPARVGGGCGGGP